MFFFSFPCPDNEAKCGVEFRYSVGSAFRIQQSYWEDVNLFTFARLSSGAMMASIIELLFNISILISNKSQSRSKSRSKYT